MSRMPIAEVAGDTAARAALEEVAQAMTVAQGEGRVVHKIDLAAIAAHHLNRDRLAMGEADFETLKSSIAARGQQTPIEVVRLKNGHFGLVSGLRRVMALRALGVETALAFVRTPQTAEAAYVAMVEENEIRADLSFYERANIAVQAAEAGVYSNPRAAVRGLFAHSPSARRSKIQKFVPICRSLGAKLKFPEAIPEKLGLTLANALEADPGLAGQIREDLRKAKATTPAAERRVLERALKGPKTAGGAGQGRGREVAPGVMMTAKKGRVVLTGPGVDQGLIELLEGLIVCR